MKNKNSIYNFVMDNKLLSIILAFILYTIGKKVFQKLRKDQTEKEANQIVEIVQEELNSKKNFNDDAKLLVNYIRPEIDIPFIGRKRQPIWANGDNNDERIISLIITYTPKEFEALKEFYAKQNLAMTGQSTTLVEDLRTALSNSQFNRIKNVF